jgi:hypothetical protein
MRVNMPRAGTGLGFRDEPPTLFNQSAWTTPFNVTNAGAGFVLFQIDPADEWATTNMAGMWVFVSDGRPSSVNFYKAPFRRAKLVRGFSVNPPAATQFLLDPWGMVSAERRWLRSYVLLGDGRVSSARIQPLDDNV